MATSNSRNQLKMFEADCVQVSACGRSATSSIFFECIVCQKIRANGTSRSIRGSAGPPESILAQVRRVSALHFNSRSHHGSKIAFCVRIFIGFSLTYPWKGVVIGAIIIYIALLTLTWLLQSIIFHSQVICSGYSKAIWTQV